MTIRDIYAVISEMAVGDVQARNLPEIKLTVRIDDCPLRLLLPNTQGETAFVAIGTMTKTIWTIRDLCLWQPVMGGAGIEQCADEMLAYVELYLAAIKTIRNPVPGATIVSVTLQLGPVAWATEDYWAVDTTILVEEFIP
jgi:hypothetical protein